MARLAYVIEVDPAHLGPLGYIAGLLQGQGVPQGALLAELLGNVQVVEVPDEFGQSPTSALGAAQPGPENEDEFEEITPENDPTAPENLGIDLGDGPPEIITPFVPQSEALDFGAGPPHGA